MGLHPKFIPPVPPLSQMEREHRIAPDVVPAIIGFKRIVLEICESDRGDMFYDGISDTYQLYLKLEDCDRDPTMTGGILSAAQEVWIVVDAHTWEKGKTS